MIDSHCHLDFPELNNNLARVLQQAQVAGVRQFIVPSVSEQNWQQVATISATYPDVYCAFGLHPWFINQHYNLSLLAQYLKKPKCVAVGECGLDFYHKDSDRLLQQEIFLAQIELANSLNLPLIVHSRKAVDQVLSLLAKYPNITVVLHGFAGSIEQAKLAIKRNFYLGVGTNICNPKASKIRKLAQFTPLERILLETDSPDQRLKNHQFGTPADLLSVAQELAKLKNLAFNTVLLQCQLNTKNCFKL